MSSFVRSSLAVLAFAMLGACMAHSRGSALSRRAAFDMQCPETKLQAVKIDDRTYGVSGCGQRATYVETCTNVDCTWVMNANSTSAPKPEPVSTTEPAAPPS